MSTTERDFIFDRDFENDKVYMVKDPYEEIKPGTEQAEWFGHELLKKEVV